MNHCGIDLASKASAVCVMDAEGRIIREAMVATDESGFRVCLGHCEPMQIVVEASPLAEWTARVVESLGHEVVVIDPRRAKAVICTKKKTDRLDARHLAKMSCTGWYTQVHRKSNEARLSRSELKARQGLVETANAMGARIRGLLRAHGIRLGRVNEGEFEARVWDRVSSEAPELKAVLRPLLKIWREATRAADRMYRRLGRRSRRDPLRERLMSVPGVGPAVATAFVATVDDPSRFRRSDQVPAYLGLVPGVHQSGEVEMRGSITKEGDGLLRWLLVEAAHVLLTRTRRSCALKRWGLKLQASKGVGKARVAVARKLAMILHRIWLTGESFDWQKA